LSRLLIGVPARNEADRIVELADRIERGAALLDASFECCLALAYQASDDDTLDRFATRSARIPQVVLQERHTAVGKGANVKLLLRRALDDSVDFLLLVDADLGDYDPGNLARVVESARQHGHSLVLPLWCRPHGQGNTTNYLASPILFATHRARVRQPLAGHMLLHRSLLEQIDVDALPDDFGVDIMITLTALAGGASIAQVPLVAPGHPSKEGNSERVMIEVATAVLRALTDMPIVDRPDVRWPEHYWAGWEWPRNDGIDPDHVEVILQHAGSDAELLSWLELGDATDEAVAEMWCDHLADAVRRSRSPYADLARIVTDLVCPFFVHAEYRARRGASVAELEQYVADLGLRLAARLHG
jgi:glycosyltransferase involved in cell wall biosynthesis